MIVYRASRRWEREPRSVFPARLDPVTGERETLMRNRLYFTLFCSVLLLGLLANPLSAEAQQTQAASYQAISDRFFDMLQQDKIPDAIDEIFSTNPAMKKVPDKVEDLKSQFVTFRKLAGPYVSHTKLVESKVAGMFVYQHYFVAYERQPISVRIKYYKPGSTWLCQGLQFDVNVDDMIQKAADERIPVELR
jgi:hypothetical protein